MQNKLLIKRNFIFLFLALIVSRAFSAGTGTTFEETGRASYYADYMDGHKTACGEFFRKDEFTAAHKTLPFGTLVRVIHLKTNAEVVVRINDRGPYITGRIVDLSGAAAEKLGMKMEGVALVRIEVIAPEDTVTKHVEPLSDVAIDEFHSWLKLNQLPSEEVPGNGFAIQIGEFSNAFDLKAAYLGLGKFSNSPFYIYKQEKEGKLVYIGLVGGFKTKDEADIAAVDEEFPYPGSSVVDLEKRGEVKLE